MTFIALASAVAILWRGPFIDRMIVVLSALPIAVVANVLRITLTGICAETVGHGIADLVFHDLAGWIMMPMAFCGLLWIEITVFDMLFTTVRGDDAVSPFFGRDTTSSLPPSAEPLHSTTREKEEERFHQDGLATPGGTLSRHSVPHWG